MTLATWNDRTDPTLSENSPVVVADLSTVVEAFVVFSVEDLLVESENMKVCYSKSTIPVKTHQLFPSQQYREQ